MISHWYGVYVFMRLQTTCMGITECILCPPLLFTKPLTKLTFKLIKEKNWKKTKLNISIIFGTHSEKWCILVYVSCKYQNVQAQKWKKRFLRDSREWKMWAGAHIIASTWRRKWNINRWIADLKVLMWNWMSIFTVDLYDLIFNK